MVSSQSWRAGEQESCTTVKTLIAKCTIGFLSTVGTSNCMAGRHHPFSVDCAMTAGSDLRGTAHVQITLSNPASPNGYQLKGLLTGSLSITCIHRGWELPIIASIVSSKPKLSETYHSRRCSPYCSLVRQNLAKVILAWLLSHGSSPAALLVSANSSSTASLREVIRSLLLVVKQERGSSISPRPAPRSSILT